MSNEHKDGGQNSSSAVLDPTMSLVGRLEDLSLGEILQIVSLSKRSGLLRLESPGGKASLYIRAGKVIYAASSDERDGVWGLLVDNGLVKEDQLAAFLKKLDSASSPQAFRELLSLETGISQEQIQEVLRTRVEELSYALFIWEEGTFSFQLIEDESTHPQLSKVAPFFLDEGVGAQFLVMEGARRKDEMMRDAPSTESLERVPMVDPDKMLGDDWEQEFEEQLAGPGSAEETQGACSQQDLENELEEFVVPDSLPRLTDSLPGKVVAVGLQAPLLVEITGSFVRAGIELLTYENGADALTKIQELRQQGIDPYLLLDMETPGITDGRMYGGLEIISTMWDFGFHLPVALVCRGEIQEQLENRLHAVTGLTLFKMPEPLDQEIIRAIQELITASVDTSPAYGDGPGLDGSVAGTGSDGVSVDIPVHLPELEEKSEIESQDVTQGGEAVEQGEEYYDIEQEFSEELGDIDLPVDDWEGAQSAPQEASLDPHMARLTSYVNELNRQDISGEITLLALRFASAFANRAILFLVRKEDLKGLGQFGVDLGQGRNADSVVRSLNLPMEEKSLFARVAQHQQSYKGPPTDSETESALFKALGGGVPGEIFIGPIVSMGKVAVLLYGDDYPLCDGLEPTHTLDIFLSHVGLALDRAFLEMKLKSQ